MRILSAVSRDAILSGLSISRFRLLFKPENGIIGEKYWGSAWRGVLGHSLKKLVCISRCATCQDCLLYSSCVYTYVFETPPPPGSAKLRKYKAVPHPFVLALPWPESEPAIEDGVPLGLTLFGRGTQYVAYVICALREAGTHGLHGMGPLMLESVSQEVLSSPGTWQEIYQDTRLSPLPPATPVPPPMPERVRIRFLTPLRLRHNQEYVGAGRFTFADLFGSLLRRISSLTYFHTGQPLETDFAALMAISHTIPAQDTDLRWQDWTRFSSRQQEELQMGGLVGGITAALAGHEELWPFLWLGQWTHAGKGTSMGLGRYVLEFI